MGVLKKHVFKVVGVFHGQLRGQPSQKKVEKGPVFGALENHRSFQLMVVDWWFGIWI